MGVSGGGAWPFCPGDGAWGGRGRGGWGGGFKVQLPQPLQGLACHGTSCKAKQAIAKSTGGCGPGCPSSMLGAQSRHLHPLFSSSSNAPSCQPFPTARTNCAPILRPGGLRPRGLRSPGAHCSHDPPSVWPTWLLAGTSVASVSRCCALPARTVPKGQEHSRQSRARPGAESCTWPVPSVPGWGGGPKAEQRSRGDTCPSAHGHPPAT